MKLIGHLRTVMTHRRIVRRYCFRAGLYFQGITHDLSKYSPVEFINGVKYFTGTKSPHSGERADKGYSACRVYHKENYRNSDAYDYYMKSKDKCPLHPETSELLCRLLTMVKDEGEDAAFRYIRNELLKK